MTLSDLQDQSPITSLSKLDFPRSCAAVDKISTDIARRTANSWASCWLKLVNSAEKDYHILQGNDIAVTIFIEDGKFTVFSLSVPQMWHLPITIKATES